MFKKDGCQTEIIIGCRKGLINNVINGIFNGDNINATCDYYKMTGLMYASKYGHIDIVKLLLQHNCDINYSYGYDKITAFFWAIIKEHTEIMEILYKAGAKYDDKMMIKAIDLNNIKSVKTIFKLGIRVSNEALTHSVKIGNTEIIDILINNGLVLKELIFVNNLDIVKKLINNGANIYVKHNHRNLLMESCSWRNIEMVKYILEYTNIDINYTDNYGQTALMYAVYALDIDIVKLLVSKFNIDILIEDNDGNSALSIARDFKWKKCIKLLSKIIKN